MRDRLSLLGYWRVRHCFHHSSVATIQTARRCRRGRCISLQASALDHDASGSSPSSASEVLRAYARRQAEWSLPEMVSVVVSLVALQPSRYDERVLSIVESIVKRRSELPLGLLVEVSTALQSLGFYKELSELASLVVSGASFLSSDVLLAFAKVLAIAARPRGGSRVLPGEKQAAVFRILGEHVSEAIHSESPPSDLSEALLAIAIFYCSRSGGAPDPVLAAPWHHTVFSSCAERVISNPIALPLGALVRYLRAYSLFLLSGPPIIDKTVTFTGASSLPLPNALQVEGVLGSGSLETLPARLVDALTPNLCQIPASHLVRSLHCLARLHRHGLRVDSPAASCVRFCEVATEELRSRVSELRLIEVAFALEALSIIVGERISSEVFFQNVCASQGEGSPFISEVAALLYGEVLQHVPSLGVREALIIIRATPAIAKVAGWNSRVAPSPMSVPLELSAAELLRNSRSLSAEHLSHALRAFAGTRYQDFGLYSGLQAALAERIDGGHCSPKHLAISLHALASVRTLLHSTCRSAARNMLSDSLAFHPRDMAMSFWALARSSHQKKALVGTIQDTLKRRDIVSTLQPEDVSMLLWSFGRLDVAIHSDVLASLAQHVSLGIRGYTSEAVLVTCVAFARLGFSQQTVLVDLYRNLYGRLPNLTDSQFSFCFFLFSTSGVRDEALLARFLFESRVRLPRLRGNNLSNIMLACSRLIPPAPKDGSLTTNEASGGGSLVAVPDVREMLRIQLFRQLGGLGRTPLLGVYLAAPSMLALPQEDTMRLAQALLPHINAMTVAELVRVLVATAKAEIVYKPLLLPLFLAIRKQRDDLTAPELVSCIYSVYTLSFCKPKFRRTLRLRLLHSTKLREIPARTLRDILPALCHFGFWERLSVPLRRSVWRLATPGQRLIAAEPPPSPPPKSEAVEDGKKPWRLPPLQKGFFRRRRPQGQLLSRRDGLETLARDKKGDDYRKPGKELPTDAESLSGRNALQDFIEMIRRL